MFEAAKWIAPAVALALIVSFTASRSTAEEVKKETGSVAGVVQDVEGKPVSGLDVRLHNQMSKKDKSGATGTTDTEKQSAPEKKSADDQPPQQLADKPAKTKADKPIPLATATTDGDGKFTLADVPVGDYTLIARQKGVGNARQNVSVKSGEVTRVELKFKPQKNKDAAKPTNDK